MSLLRQPLLALSRSASVKSLLVNSPLNRPLVEAYVPGERADQAVAAVRSLRERGLAVSLDHLGEDTVEPAQAEEVVQAYLTLIALLADQSLADGSEVSVKLTAIGLALPGGGVELARAGLLRICAAGYAAGVQVSVDMEDSTTTDDTLAMVSQVRQEFPDVGAVLQAYLRRTESDCRDLAYAGSRVRLCKGAYAEAPSVAFTERHQVDLAYVRCLQVLMAGQGYPMVASHDPRLIAIARDLAHRNGRRPGEYEFQMLYGIRPTEQQRLANEGETMRVYIPYGREWYGYLVRRLAERPANLSLFLKSVIAKG